MAKRTLFQQIIIPFMAILLVAILAMGIFTTKTVRHAFFNGIVTELQKQALTATIPFQDTLKTSTDPTAIQQLCVRLGSRTETRFTLIALDGVVLGDSDNDPAEMDNHRDRPEVVDVMRGQRGLSDRYSMTMREKMLYVALPVRVNNEIRAVLRVSMPETRVDVLINYIVRNILLGAAAIALMAILFSLFVSHRISHPLQNMKKAAEHFARGDFSIRIEPEHTDELKELADAMNGMADQLDANIQTIKQQTKERESMLSSMVELENIRRDFVANVSHELRTPITSIKGFVETLQENAPDDPETSRHFLRIIARQADRLNAIIEDLLSLSRIERDAEQHDIRMEPALIRDVLEAALQTCRVKADSRKITFRLDCSVDLEANINRDLLEQAVINLLDNAVKYSPEGGVVTLSAGAEDGGIYIRVTDHGCGIPHEHLPRLFERFYRVDKDRSRELGGTGLGLAIVKHIVTAHGGQVAVESTVGKGSIFTLFLMKSSCSFP